MPHQTATQDTESQVHAHLCVEINDTARHEDECPQDKVYLRRTQMLFMQRMPNCTMMVILQMGVAA